MEDSVKFHIKYIFKVKYKVVYFICSNTNCYCKFCCELDAWHLNSIFLKFYPENTAKNWRIVYIKYSRLFFKHMKYKINKFHGQNNFLLLIISQLLIYRDFNKTCLLHISVTG